MNKNRFCLVSVKLTLENYSSIIRYHNLKWVKKIRLAWEFE